MDDGRWEADQAEPSPSNLGPRASDLLADMDLVRRVVSLGRVARKGAGLRVRQPLGRMLVAVGRPEEREALVRLKGELLDELNVKELELLDSSDGARLQRFRLRPNLRLLGPRLGKGLPALRAALEGLEPTTAAGLAAHVAQGQSVKLFVEGEEVTLAPEEVLVETLPLEGYAVAQEGSLQVALDTDLDDELRLEGLARDLVRAVQEARKGAGLALADRVELYLVAAGGDAALLDAALAAWGDYLCAETLAVVLHTTPPPPSVATQMVDLDGVGVLLAVERR